MGDPLKHVHAGEPVRVSAETFNCVIDATRDYRERTARFRQGPPGLRVGGERPTAVFRVRNDTGADRALFEIVSLDGPVYGPSDNLQEFKFRFAFKGVVPDSDHFGRFAVLLEPVKDGAIGRALVQGITPVLVRVPDLGEHESGEYADINTAEGDLCAHLVTGPRGAAFILWLADKDPELPEGDPDIRWAIVRVSSATPSDAAAAIHTLKVTGVYGAYNVPFDPEVHPFILYVTGYFAFSDKSWVDESTEFYVKATNLLEDARVGFKNIQVGDFVGYAMLDGFEPVPGGPEDAIYDGQVIAFPGPEGALLTTSTKIDGGAGITVEPNPDPAKDEPKVSVDLADTSPGLEFTPTQDPDDGQLRVKPDSDKGIDAGAQGLFVIVNPNQGIGVDAQGVKALADATRAVSITQNGIGVDVDPNYALQVSGNKVQVVVKTAGGIELTNGALDIPEHADGGLNHREDGRLGVKADSSRGLDTDTDGVFVRLKADGGLAFDSGEMAHDLGTATQGQLVTDVAGENLGTQDAADLFDANGHLVAAVGKTIRHTTPGAFAFGDEVNAHGFHGIGLDANGHVRKIWLSGLGWIGPNA